MVAPLAAAAVLFLVSSARHAGADTTPPGAAPAPAYETVVTAPAENARRPAEDDAASASVIDADRTPRTAESLPQLLSELPGVSITRFGALGALSMISIRGSTPNQVQVYVDGVPLATASAGAVDLGLIPLADAQRIEVYRGVSPVGFGTSALGGIVSLQSRTPDSSGGNVEAGLGSFGTRFAGGQAMWVGTGSWLKVFAAAHLLDSAGDFPYLNDNGSAFDTSDDSVRRRRNNQLSQADGTLRAVLALPGRRTLTTSWSLLGREQGLPAPGAQESYTASFGARRLIGSLAYDSRDDLGPGGRLRAQTYTVMGLEQFRDERHEIAYAPTRTHDRTDTVGETVRLTRVFAAWLKGTAMADGRFESFRPHDDLATVPDGVPGTRAFAAAAVEADAWARGLDLDVIPSLRLEVARDHISGRDALINQVTVARPASYVLPIARVGIIERLGPALALRANGGRYARLPSMLERYGNTGRVLGNPDLRPEIGFNGDAGATLTLAGGPGSLTLDAAGFAAWVDDLIQFQKGAYQLRARNIGRARILGAELAADARIGRHGRLCAQGTFTDALDQSGVSGADGHQLPLRPRVRAYARPELRAVRLFGRWEGGVYGDVDVTGGNYLDPANLVQVPARVLFGAGLYVDERSTGLRGVLTALNLGDSRINDVADFPLPGRSIFFSLQWSATSNEVPQEPIP